VGSALLPTVTNAAGLPAPANWPGYATLSPDNQQDALAIAQALPLGNAANSALVTLNHDPNASPTQYDSIAVGFDTAHQQIDQIG
jgi:hypothetical protein